MTVRCIVPFCGRSTSRFTAPQEWICTDHWALVPAHVKRVYRRAKRRSDVRVRAIVWMGAKKRAIEAAFRIG